MQLKLSATMVQKAEQTYAMIEKKASCIYLTNNPCLLKRYVDIPRLDSSHKRFLSGIRCELPFGLPSQERMLNMNKPLTSLSSGPIPVPRPKLRASQIRPYDLAIALTLMEGDRYRMLGPQDCLAFLMKHPGHNFIKDVYNTHKNIILWVKSSILHYEKKEERSEVLKFFIHTAEVSVRFPPCPFCADLTIHRNVQTCATFLPPLPYPAHYTALKSVVCDSQHRPCRVLCD